MNPLRVLIVTDRFWPIVDPAAMAHEQLAHALARRGHAVRVLSRRWQKYSSPQMRIGDVEVTRLPFNAPTRFGTLRQTRQLNLWIESHRANFDLLLIDPQDTLCAPLLPLVARAQIPICFWPAVAEAGELDPSLRHPKRNLSTIQRCSAWIGPVAEPWREWAACLVDDKRLCRLGPFVDCDFSPNINRTAARAALAENHPLFNVGSQDPLVITIGTGADRLWLCEWIDGWEAVSRIHRMARLWIIGAGVEFPRIAEHIRLRQLEHLVLLTGRFDDWSDVMRAADLYLEPRPSSVPLFPVRYAMTAELPVLVGGGALGENAWLEPGISGFASDSMDPHRKAQDLIDILGQPELRESVARTARQRVQRDHSLDAGINMLERLGRELVGKPEKVRS